LIGRRSAHHGRQPGRSACCHSSRQLVDPADAIRVVGTINDRLAKLDTHEIYVFYGYRLNYRATPDDLCKIWVGKDDEEAIVPFRVTRTADLGVVFTTRPDDLIIKDIPNYYGEEYTQSQSIVKNLELCIHPDWFEPNPYGIDEAYVASIVPPMQKLIQSKNSA
jgi:hypothetical protein